MTSPFSTSSRLASKTRRFSDLMRSLSVGFVLSDRAHTAERTTGRAFLYLETNSFNPFTVSKSGKTVTPSCSEKVPSNQSPSDFPQPFSIYAARRAMPHAPPSPAVFITVTGAPTAAARYFCGAPSVLNSPPCPTTESTETSSFFIISSPIFSVANMEYKCARIRFARSKRLSVVRISMGRPSVTSVMFSPET